MAVLKRRPKIQLRAPVAILPGDSVVVHAVLDVKGELPINAVKVRLTGIEWATTGSGDSARTHRQTRIDLEAEVLGKTSLDSGRVTYPCRFDLPASLPPSYRGQRAGVVYTTTVHVDIPWWPDARAPFDIVVRPHPASHDAPRPGLYSTAPEGPRGEEPYYEISLADTVIAPGRVLEGSISFQNASQNRYREAKLSLVATEERRRPNGATSRGETARYGLSLDVDGVVDGASVPFRMRLPEDIHWTRHTQYITVSWQLEVRAVIPWRSDHTVHIPITILPPGSSVVKRERFAPPTVGSERVQREWQKAADRHGLMLDGDQLIGDIDGVELTLRRDHRGKEGIFLVARLTYEDLGMSLDGGLRSGFQRLLGGGVDLGAASWEQRHYLDGRDEAQVISLGSQLVTTLGHLTLDDISDEGATIRRRGAGQTFRSLDGLLQPVIAFARRMATMRYRVPVPAVMSGDEEGWNTLAQRLGGRLATSSMAVGGQVDGVPARVETEWSVDGKPVRTTLELRPAFEIERDHTRVWAGSSWDDGGLPAEARAYLPILQKDALGLVVETDRLELSLPAPATDAPAFVDRLRQLARFAPMLRTKAGPYR